MFYLYQLPFGIYLFLFFFFSFSKKRRRTIFSESAIQKAMKLYQLHWRRSGSTEGHVTANGQSGRTCHGPRKSTSDRSAGTSQSRRRIGR